MREFLWRRPFPSPTVEQLKSRLAPAFGAVIDLSTLSGEDGFQLAPHSGELGRYSVNERSAAR
jgi:hypothetical protein